MSEEAKDAHNPADSDPMIADSADKEENQPLLQRNRGFLILVAGLSLVGFFAWMAPDPGFIEREQAQDISEEIKTGKLPEAQRLEASRIILFVPDKDNLNLWKVVEPINLPERMEERIKSTVEALFRNGKTMNAIFPEGMSLKGVYVFKKTAFVSISSEFKKRYVAGAWTELLAVYSMVDTICENFKEIKEVKLLIDDKEGEIFASHVDISLALSPDYSFVLTDKQKQSPTNGVIPSKSKGAAKPSGKNG